MKNEYLIPKITRQGYALIGARTGGEIAASIAAEIRKESLQKNPYNGQIDQSNLSKFELYKSELGTSVMEDVTFESITYTDNKDNEVTTPKMTFQAILVDVNLPRNIVKTEIQGRDGTVKEYIGEGDVQINFRGVITGQNGHYPSDEVESLLKIIKAPIAIPVTSDYLLSFDVTNIVFEDRGLEREEGGYSYQAYSLHAISDTPQELQITGK
jgi:hypothetical protein